MGAHKGPAHDDAMSFSGGVSAQLLNLTNRCELNGTYGVVAADPKSTDNRIAVRLNFQDETVIKPKNVR
eukprot:3526860-Karenia_brevis.AAC.1